LQIRTAAEFFELLNRHRFAECAEMLGPDCAYVAPGVRKPARGRQAIKELLREEMWNYPALRWVLGSKGYQLHEVRDTAGVTPALLVVKWCCVAETEKGLIRARARRRARAESGVSPLNMCSTERVTRNGAACEGRDVYCCRSPTSDDRRVPPAEQWLTSTFLQFRMHGAVRAHIELIDVEVSKEEID
jgi:hypothetical protein